MSLAVWAHPGAALVNVPVAPVMGAGFSKPVIKRHRYGMYFVHERLFMSNQGGTAEG
ncbi:hypothetical protein JCM39194_18890 [Desulfotomaculum varum]